MRLVVCWSQADLSESSIITEAAALRRRNAHALRGERASGITLRNMTMKQHSDYQSYIDKPVSQYSRSFDPGAPLGDPGRRHTDLALCCFSVRCEQSGRGPRVLRV